MIRKLIERYLPDRKVVTGSRSVRLLGNTVHDSRLWHLSRRSVAMAFFVGIFSAFVPVPFQMIISAALAVVLRCNLPLAVALVWITNPVTMPVIYYTTYVLGCHLLDVPVSPAAFHLSIQSLGDGLVRIWRPLFLGSMLSGTMLGLTGYITIMLLWRWQVVLHWRSRRQLKNRKGKQQSPQ